MSHLTNSMFLDGPVALARYDILKYPWIDKLTEKQLGFFWRPEEIDLSQDSSDFASLSDSEKHIFTSNLKYQILLDSVQGSSPSSSFGLICSLPEIESWINAWTFFESIHSRSYTHIIRNIYVQPTEVFDTILTTKEIQVRSASITENYDNLERLISEYNLSTAYPKASHELEDALFRTMVSVNVLEGIRFYVSFACSFSFAERKLMEGNAKVIKAIARDEAVHLAYTQRTLQHWINGLDSTRMQDCAIRNFNYIEECFREAAEQEKDWADYLFKDGSMIGLNSTILKQYVEYITNVRIKALGLTAVYPERDNPLPWMNNWLLSDNVQVAPQETEITSYLTGAIDSSVDVSDFENVTL